MRAFQLWFMVNWMLLTNWWNCTFQSRKHRIMEATDLGEVMVKTGMTSPAAVKIARDKQKKEFRGMKIGEVMLTLGHINPAQLRSALHTQKLMRRGKHADVMMDIVEERMNDMRSQQLNRPI